MASIALTPKSSRKQFHSAASVLIDVLNGEDDDENSFSDFVHNCRADLAHIGITGIRRGNLTAKPEPTLAALTAAILKRVEACGDLTKAYLFDGEDEDFIGELATYQQDLRKLIRDLPKQMSVDSLTDQLVALTAEFTKIVIDTDSNEIELYLPGMVLLTEKPPVVLYCGSDSNAKKVKGTCPDMIVNDLMLTVDLGDLFNGDESVFGTFGPNAVRKAHPHIGQHDPDDGRAPVCLGENGGKLTSLLEAGCFYEAMFLLKLLCRTWASRGAHSHYFDEILRDCETITGPEHLAGSVDWYKNRGRVTPVKA